MKIFNHNNNLNYFILLILFLIPLSAIFSRFLLNFLIIFFFLFLVVYSIFNEWSFIKSEITPYLFFFLIYLLANSVFLDSFNGKGIIKALWILAIIFFILGMSSFIFLINRQLLNKLILFLFLITIFVQFDSLYQFFNPDFKDIFGFQADTIRSYYLFGQYIKLPIRLSGPFGDENVVGFYLATYGLLSIFLIKNFYKISFIKYYTLIFFNLLIIILSGERSSVIMYFMTIFFFEFFNKKNLLNRILIILSIFFVILVSILIIPNTNERFSDLSNWMFKADKNHKIDFVQNLNKTPWGGHWLMSTMLIKENILFGVGLRNFTKSCESLEKRIKIYPYKSQCSTHPHHYILEIMVETGAVGLILFFTFITKILHSFFIKYRNDENMLMTISVLFGFLFPLKPSGAIFSSWFGSFFWFIILFYLIIEKKKINV